MTFSNPITGGGGALVRTDIHSKGYTAGVTGWSIQKNGSAEFNNGIFRGPLSLGPASPSPRIKFVSGADIPAELQSYYTSTFGKPVAEAELFYANATDYYYIANLDFSTYDIIATGYAVGGTTVHEFEQNSWDPVFSFISQNHGLKTTITETIGDASRAPSTFERTLFQESMTTVFRGPTRATKIDAEMGGVAETWQAVVGHFQNGWSNNAGGQPFEYRKVASPANCIQVRGEIVPGTLADTTIITNFPAGYRPANIQSWSARKAAGAQALLQLNANGDVRVYDAAGSTLLIFTGAILSLD